MGRKYCKKHERYYVGENCPDCNNEIPIRHSLSDVEIDAMKEACTWYNKHFLGYPAGKYYKCFFGDMQKALNEVLVSSNKKYSKAIRDGSFGNISYFVRILTYAWQYGHIPIDFENRLKELHSISVEKVKNSRMISNIIDLRNAQTINNIADFI